MIRKSISLILALVLLCGMLPQTVFLASAEETGHIHSYEPAVTSPICTEQGYTTYTCTCGDSYVDSYVAAKGHVYENDICTGCGIKDYRDVTYVAFGDSITYGVDGN